MLLGKALIHLFTPSLLNTWADWYFVVLISNQSQRRKTKSQTIKEQWNALHYTPLENSWQFTDNKEREALESHNYVHAEGIKHKRKRKKKDMWLERLFSLWIYKMDTPYQIFTYQGPTVQYYDLMHYSLKSPLKLLWILLYLTWIKFASMKSNHQYITIRITWQW